MVKYLILAGLLSGCLMNESEPQTSPRRIIRWDEEDQCEYLEIRGSDTLFLSCKMEDTES